MRGVGEVRRVTHGGRILDKFSINNLDKMKEHLFSMFGISEAPRSIFIATPTTDEEFQMLPYMIHFTMKSCEERNNEDLEGVIWRGEHVSIHVMDNF